MDKAYLNQNLAQGSTAIPTLNSQITNAISRINSLAGLLRNCGDDLCGSRPSPIEKDAPSPQNLQSMLAELHRSLNSAEEEANRIRQNI